MYHLHALSPNLRDNSHHECVLSQLLLFGIWDRILHSPYWPKIHYLAIQDLELLILLFLSPKCCDFRYIHITTRLYHEQKCIYVLWFQRLRHVPCGKSRVPVALTADSHEDSQTIHEPSVASCACGVGGPVSQTSMGTRVDRSISPDNILPHVLYHALLSNSNVGLNE